MTKRILLLIAAVAFFGIAVWGYLDGFRIMSVLGYVVATAYCARLALRPSPDPGREAGG